MLNLIITVSLKLKCYILIVNMTGKYFEFEENSNAKSFYLEWKITNNS